MQKNQYALDKLLPKLTNKPGETSILFLGKSILENPGNFILPILMESLEEVLHSGKRLVLDFRELTYMNSSTLTPIIKILERVRIAGGEITLRYRKSQEWQHVSFSALSIFLTPDGRIAIDGQD